MRHLTAQNSATACTMEKHFVLSSLPPLDVLASIGFDTRPWHISFLENRVLWIGGPCVSINAADLAPPHEGETDPAVFVSLLDETQYGGKTVSFVIRASGRWVCDLQLPDGLHFQYNACSPWSPHGTYICAIAPYRYICLFDSHTGVMVTKAENTHVNKDTRIKFSPDERLLAICVQIGRFAYKVQVVYILAVPQLTLVATLKSQKHDTHVWFQMYKDPWFVTINETDRNARVTTSRRFDLQLCCFEDHCVFSEVDTSCIPVEDWSVDDYSCHKKLLIENARKLAYEQYTAKFFHQMVPFKDLEAALLRKYVVRKIWLSDDLDAEKGGSELRYIGIVLLKSLSDHTLRLFRPRLRTRIFLLMCVRHRLAMDRSCTLLPVLPTEIWLLIFNVLERSM